MNTAETNSVNWCARIGSALSSGTLWMAIAGCMVSVGWLPSIACAQTEELAAQKKAETDRFFEEAHSALDSALEFFDGKDKLPGEKEQWFYEFLAANKESHERKIEGYLDAAAEALGLSSVSDRRIRIGELRKKMAAQRKNITLYQRKMISAPDKTYNPLSVTKTGYQKKIDSAKSGIEGLELSIASEKEALVAELKRIGMDLDEEKIDLLLESITGDEFVRVSIIFDNAKAFALELEQLTEKTGEDLEAAKKYYGVYLMLLKTIDRLQNKFVENVDVVYYPKLDEFADAAQKNIAHAEKSIEAGGNAQVLNNNIYSNQTAFEATQLYKQVLSQQKHEMMMANLECKKNILTAANTYKTVSLSKDLANLLSTSRRAFDSIANLTVPDLRPFENAKMREAFGKITRELRK